jgi:hypothetical protein
MIASTAVSGAVVRGGGGGAQAHRALGKDCDRLALLQAGPLDGSEARRQDVAGEQGMAVVHAVGNEGGRVVRPVQQKGFTLRAKQDVEGSIEGGTELRLSASAALAVPAAEQARGHDAVAGFESLHPFSYGFDDPHGFVAHGSPGGNDFELVHQVNVGAADRGQSGADQGLSGTGIRKIQVGERDAALSFLEARFHLRHELASLLS